MIIPRWRMAVTGRAGQVARSLQERASRHADFEVILVGRPELDLAQPQSILGALRAVRPDVIVSCAAYTAVDLAEKEVQFAEAVNAVAPGEVGRTAAVLNVPVIHLSTDYVFDGTKAGAYIESDPPAPVCVYGQTKQRGEEAISSATDNCAILRSAWIYSPFGRNFVRTMLTAAQSRGRLSVVADQTGNPTSALDLADGILAVARNLLLSADRTLRGTFHMAGQGAASWADLAEEVLKASQRVGGPFATVERIPSSQYPTPARRPANSRLDCTRLAEIHGVRLPSWRNAIATVVERLLSVSGNVEGASGFTP